MKKIKTRTKVVFWYIMFAISVLSVVIEGCINIWIDIIRLWNIIASLGFFIENTVKWFKDRSTNQK